MAVAYHGWMDGCRAAREVTRRSVVRYNGYVDQSVKVDVRMRINVRWLLLHRGRGIGHVLGLIFAVSSGSSVATVQDVLQEVTVTGSLIRQNPLEVRSPVQVFTSADIEKSGIVGLGDYLQSLPIAGASINRSNNTAGNLGFPPDGSGTGTGASEIDLRYLGSKRTLVLVDGRRWVHGSSASGVSGAVDLNTIPANAIESIEILQDGASTIYGSDAIAGVVNVITHKRYDGDRPALTGPALMSVTQRSESRLFSSLSSNAPPSSQVQVAYSPVRYAA